MFTDIHCHLCPGLDDGPRTLDEALEICHLAWQEGIRTIGALAHQNDAYPENTPERITESVNKVAAALHELEIPLQLVPWSEVMIGSDTLDQWDSGKLLAAGDPQRHAASPKNTETRKHRNTVSYLLLEFPHGLFLDIRDLAMAFVRAGVTPVIAHAERYPELLHDTAMTSDLIAIGCVIQVNSGSVVETKSRTDERALRDWFRRSVVHVIGSDAHSPRRRRPLMAEAYDSVVRWTDDPTARQIFQSNGEAVLTGRPLRVPKPLPSTRKTFWSSLING